MLEKLSLPYCIHLNNFFKHCLTTCLNPLGYNFYWIHKSLASQMTRIRIVSMFYSITTVLLLQLLLACRY